MDLSERIAILRRSLPRAAIAALLDISLSEVQAVSLDGGEEVDLPGVVDSDISPSQFEIGFPTSVHNGELGTFRGLGFGGSLGFGDGFYDTDLFSPTGGASAEAPQPQLDILREGIYSMGGFGDGFVMETDLGENVDLPSVQYSLDGEFDDMAAIRLVPELYLPDGSTPESGGVKSWVVPHFGRLLGIPEGGATLEFSIATSTPDPIDISSAAKVILYLQRLRGPLT